MIDYTKPNRTCCGGCNNFVSDGCRGKIQRVKVEKGTAFYPPLIDNSYMFDYCERAIAEDRKNGFKVTVIEDELETEER